MRAGNEKGGEEKEQKLRASAVKYPFMNTVNSDLYETPSFPFFHTGIHGASKLNVSARTTSGR